MGTVCIDVCRRRYSKELNQLCGELAIIAMIKLVVLRWIGQINRMHSNRNVKTSI